MRQGRANRYSLREIQILSLVAGGRTNKEIGTALNISCRTVETHIRRLLVRRGSHNRAEAVVTWLMSEQNGNESRLSP
jgi:DNA-binding NarL/FixJ family response regulator